MPARFIVARNPDDASSLPYLLRIPVAGPPLLLKARGVWPRTSKVFCHPLDVWPDDPDVVEEVDVRSCERRGRAVDLVLDRGREHRSQFVFVTLRGGREAVFWQTAKTAAAARPGVRIPSRRAAGIDDLEIVVDTRERYAYRFATQQASVRRAALRVGDYAVELDGAVVAAVERKSVADLVRRLVDGQLAFAMADLAALPRAAVVVDGRYADALKAEHVQPGFVADLLARVAVRFPSVPVVFAGSRKLAEEWTYRYLAAAYAEAIGEQRFG
ncbi:MAG TPA: ERCC4 domain-containing protein [Egicoccus sp.]|nr:ERCC4 domain-containing protein [Egicoccus sp.]